VAGDIDSMHTIWLEPDVLRYLCDGERVPRERIEEIVDASGELFRDQALGLWCIETQAATELIGFAAFWYFHEPPVLELMYGLKSAAWGHGYATEAARALLRYGFEHLGMETIRTSTDVPNVASVRVMERAGFRFDRRTEDGLWGMLHYTVARRDLAPWDQPFRLITADADE